MPDPAVLPETGDLPELMTFADGSPVETPEDWERRRAEILALYSHYVYGSMPDPAGETLTWALSEEAETGGTLLTVTVEANGARGELAVLVTLPQGEAPLPQHVHHMSHAGGFLSDGHIDADHAGVLLI